MAERLEKALAAIDAANAEDPNLESIQGELLPKELVYAQRMTQRLSLAAPDASDTLRLAARAQHIRRWTIPRDTYAHGRAGYHAWRRALAQFHAETTGEIMRNCGYEDEAIAHAGALLRKEGLGQDPEMQVLEDVICLVFLEHYFTEFAAKHTREKLIPIVQRTWGKMSPAAHEEALRLPWNDEERAFLKEALSPS